MRPIQCIYCSVAIPQWHFAYKTYLEPYRHCLYISSVLLLVFCKIYQVMLLYYQLGNGKHAFSGRWIEWSGCECWPGSLCCDLGQDTLLSQCLSSHVHVGVYKMGTGKFSGQPDKNSGGYLWWTSIPSLIHAMDTGVKRKPHPTCSCIVT